MVDKFRPTDNILNLISMHYVNNGQCTAFKRSYLFVPLIQISCIKLSAQLKIKHKIGIFKEIRKKGKKINTSITLNIK